MSGEVRKATEIDRWCDVIQGGKNFGAFVSLDEYSGREGFIHVSEIATGWVKYIRDYVKEGQKIVCKVIEVDRSKGHVNLSLKQVNDHQRREKIQLWKNENKARKLLDILADKIGEEPAKFYDEVGVRLIEEFSVRPCCIFQTLCMFRKPGISLLSFSHPSTYLGRRFQTLQPDLLLTLFGLF